MSAPKSTLLDPKDLAAVTTGVVLGVLLLVGFWLMCKGMGMATFVDHAAIPHQ